MKFYINSEGALIHNCVGVGRMDYFHSAYRIVQNEVVCYFHENKVLTKTPNSQCPIKVPSLWLDTFCKHDIYENAFFLGDRYHKFGIIEPDWQCINLS